MKNKITIVNVDDGKYDSGVLKDIIDSDSSLDLIGQFERGQPAIEDCIKIEPDIILIASTLPDITGCELVKVFNQICPSAKIFMTSTSFDPDFVWEAVLTGVKYFLPKPYDKQQVLYQLKTIAQISN